jgi:hypothetical protein
VVAGVYLLLKKLHSKFLTQYLHIVVTVMAAVRVGVWSSAKFKDLTAVLLKTHIFWEVSF